MTAPPPPATTGRFGRITRRLVVHWIRVMREHALLVLMVSIVSAVLAGGYAVTHARINTSTTDMLAEDLPFQQQFAAIDRLFPQDYRTVVVVVDAATPEQARAAADALAGRLRKAPELIRSVFHPAGEPFFQQNGLLFLDVGELDELGGRLAGAQPMLASLAQDPSLRGLAQVLSLALEHRDAAGGSDGRLPAEFETALQSMAGALEAVSAGQPATFSWQQAMGAGGERPFTGTRQLILLEPVFDYTSLQPAERAIALIRASAAELGLSTENGVRVRLTGEPVMLEEELKSVEESIGIANLLSLVIVVVLLIAGLRSARLVFGATLSLLIGLAWTACFAVAVVGELNLISVAFAVLFIGFGVDFGIHFALRFKECIDSGLGRGLALEEAAMGVSPGLTLTTLCASIGFLAFVPTAYQGLVELGIISAVGMAIALFTSLTVLPAYLALRRPPRADTARQWQFNQRLEEMLQRQARPILWGALALGIAAAAAVPYAWFNDSPLDLRDADTEGVSTLAELMQDEGFHPFRAAVLARNTTEAEALAAALRQLPAVSRVETAADLVPARQDEKLAMLQDWSLILSPALYPAEQRPAPTPEEVRSALAALRTTAEQAASAGASGAAGRLAAALAGFSATDRELAALHEALLGHLPPLLDSLRRSLEAEPVTLADVPAALLSRRQTPDGQVLVEVMPAADLRDPVERRRFAEAVQSVVPQASGEAIAVSESGKAVVQSFVEAGAYTFVLIGILLLVVLRTVRDSLIVMAPLVLAGLVTVATTVLIEVPFNFANVIVLPLLFGLGVSSGINMVVRGRQQGARSLLATSTPRAVLFSAFTTIGSFGSLAVSTHPGMASMGLLLTVALIYTTVFTLVVLPALRHVFSPGTRTIRRPDAAIG